MRYVFLMAVLAAIAGCSPTTDITRTSTERTAGRTPYDVVDVRPADNGVHVKMKVASMSAAHTVAEDVVVKMRARYDRVDVDVFGPHDSVQGTPAAVLRWSTTNGFTWTELHRP